MGERASRTLHIRLAPSRSLIVALAAIHLGALACALASDLPAWLEPPVAVAVLVLGVRNLALHATLRSPSAIVHLTWNGDGRWRLTRRDGRLLDAVAVHGGYSHPALVALAFRAADGCIHPVLVVPDRVDADDFRRLRVRLRCEGTACDDARAPLC